MRTKDEAGMGSKIGFVFSLMITSILLIASLVLVLFWILMYRDSYAWQENPKLEFNWHPTLMVAGFIFFSGFSMLFYRMMTCCRKIYVKLLHTVFSCLIHCMHRHRIFDRLGFSWVGVPQNSSLLLFAFMARSDHNGTLCYSVCHWILQLLDSALLRGCNCCLQSLPCADPCHIRNYHFRHGLCNCRCWIDRKSYLCSWSKQLRVLGN